VVTLDSRVRINEEVLFQEVQGEAVLLNLKSGVYFGLDPVGMRIWQLFAEHKLLADVEQVIVAEYDVTEERCSADLLMLVEDLERQGLVSVS
jgi:Coenzyme PQQ synthesis protein D (PqqD)